MKILVLVAGYPTEFKYTFAFVHARAKIYLKNDNEVLVYVPSKFTKRVVFEGVSVQYGSLDNFDSLMRQFAPDVAAFHAPFYLQFNPYLKFLNRLHIPYMVWLHGSEGLYKSCYYPPKFFSVSVFKDVLKLFLLRKFLKNAYSVVYVSDWLKKTIEKNIGFSHDNSFVIANPVDTNLFKRSSLFNFVKSAVSVRSFAWKYGLDIAVKAFSKLPKFDLTILGSGGMKKSLEAVAGSNIIFGPNLITHNFMPKFLNEYNFFVAPSRLEAQGVSMCEALSCGLPVVASNVGGIPEFVKDGYNGLLVIPEDPFCLAAAVRKLYSDESKFFKMCENARASAVANFSHRVIYAKEIDVLRGF